MVTDRLTLRRLAMWRKSGGEIGDLQRHALPSLPPMLGPVGEPGRPEGDTLARLEQGRYQGRPSRTNAGLKAASTSKWLKTG